MARSSLLGEGLAESIAGVTVQVSRVQEGQVTAVVLVHWTEWTDLTLMLHRAREFINVRICILFLLQ